MFNIDKIENKKKVANLSGMIGRAGMVIFPNYRAGICSSLYYSDICA